MKIILAAQYLEIFKFHRQAKFYKNFMKLKKFAIPLQV